MSENTRYDCGECPDTMGCLNRCMKAGPRHTPEPWSIAEHESHPWIIECNSNIEGIKGEICKIGYKPNARRIVACINACVDIPTVDLEMCPPGGMFHLAAHANQLVQQRDRLLDLVKRIFPRALKREYEEARAIIAELESR